MCTQKVPYCYMPINIFVIALLKNMNLVCPVIAAFAEISTSFNTKVTILFSATPILSAVFQPIK